MSKARKLSAEIQMSNTDHVSFGGSDRIIKDWSKVNFKSKEDQKKVIGALQYFMTKPDLFAHNPQEALWKPQVAKAYQAFGTPDDFPSSILEVMKKYQISTYYDNGYEQIFDVMNLTGYKRNGFDLLDVEDGLTFDKIPIGHKLEVYKMAGAKAHVYFDAYGGALGWHRTLIDDEEYWTLENNAAAFRNKAYAKRAAVFYALIESVAAGQNITWKNPEPSTLPNTNELYTANRDAQTMNAAALNILSNVKDKGYNISPDQTVFIVLTPLQLRGRIRKALNVMQQAVAGSKTQIDYNFRQITTLGLTTTNVYYVILPKIKLVAGYRMDLKMFSQFDMLSYTDTVAGWMRYGGAIGDSKQIQRCAIS